MPARLRDIGGIGFLQENEDACLAKFVLQDALQSGLIEAGEHVEPFAREIARNAADNAASGGLIASQGGDDNKLSAALVTLEADVT